MLLIQIRADANLNNNWTVHEAHKNSCVFGGKKPPKSGGLRFSWRVALKFEFGLREVRGGDTELEVTKLVPKWPVTPRSAGGWSCGLALHGLSVSAWPLLASGWRPELSPGQRCWEWGTLVAPWQTGLRGCRFAMKRTSPQPQVQASRPLGGWTLPRGPGLRMH